MRYPVLSILLLLSLTAAVEAAQPAGKGKSSTSDTTDTTTSGGGGRWSGDQLAPVLSLPADIVVEADTAAGSYVSFAVTASDDSDSNPRVSCTPSSGSLFGLGQTAVDCSAVDKNKNTSNGSFLVLVQDTRAPQLQLPGSLETSTTGSAVAVSYSASASDLVDGAVAVSCQPSSGSQFGVGQTTVNCAAADRAGNLATGSFAVTVFGAAPDTLAPVLSVPGAMLVEASSAAGAVVNYAVTVQDDQDPAPSYSCAPASGSVFALGSTAVSCQASDKQGNLSTAGFDISVRDSQPPQLSLPGDMQLQADQAAGAAVLYQAAAQDLVDGSTALTCLPASGSLFAVGQTVVSCQSTDGSGNQAVGSFTVTLSYTQPAEPVVSGSGSVQVSWTAPTTRANGEPLPSAELGGYELYMLSEQSGNDQYIVIADPTQTSYQINDLAPDTYFFSISAYDLDGLFSEPSDIIMVVVE